MVLKWKRTHIVRVFVSLEGEFVKKKRETSNTEGKPLI